LLAADNGDPCHLGLAVFGHGRLSCGRREAADAPVSLWVYNFTTYEEKERLADLLK
jgi:hypothetical protein